MALKEEYSGIIRPLDEVMAKIISKRLRVIQMEEWKAKMAPQVCSGLTRAPCGGE